MRSTQIKRDYDKNAILDTLDLLKINQEGNNVLTHYNGRLISNEAVSNKYQVFNFSNFAKNVIDKIDDYFTPEKYSLTIAKGQQEIRLVGEDVIINGDIYKKMFNILNSTDRSRALQLNIGLMRQICTNGMVVSVKDKSTSMYVKHFKNSLPATVETFVSTLENFDVTINNQILTLESLVGSYTSFQKIANALAVGEDGIIKAHNLNRLRAFAKKLAESHTDSVDSLTYEQTRLLRDPQLFNTEYKDVDIELDSYKALNCYTEVFRNYDSGVLRRETNRILQLV
jgi:hypothetical protein